MRFESKMAMVGIAATASRESLFPAHTGERVYMAPFTKAGGLPEQLSRWQPLVDQMMEKVETDQTCFIMIDQGHVEPGKALRRHGVHIDGYWNDGGGDHDHHTAIRAHGSGGTHGSVGGGGMWRPAPSHISSPMRQRRHVGITPPINRHKPFAEKIGHDPSPSDMNCPEDWGAATFQAPEAIILTSDRRGCIGYTGEFEGPIGPGGNCENLYRGGLTGHTLLPHRIYAGNVTFLHESVPMDMGPRQLVRINTPGWTP